jgi:Protein of unknown function (DUF2971)
MKLYHFTGQQYGLLNIVHRRLKVARIRELNDPFELRGVDLSDPSDRETFKQFKNDMDNTSGILCFAENWKNPVHWSHYADHHRGICLGFEVPTNTTTKIGYNDTVLTFDKALLSKSEEERLKFFLKLSTTKFKHWEYEQEHRKSIPLTPKEAKQPLNFVDFSDELKLSEVIVGSLSAVTRKEIDDALGDLRATVVCKKARLAFKTFEVTEQICASLWS